MKVVIFYSVGFICTEVYLGLGKKMLFICRQSPKHKCKLGKLCSYIPACSLSMCCGLPCSQGFPMHSCKLCTAQCRGHRSHRIFII